MRLRFVLPLILGFMVLPQLLGAQPFGGLGFGGSASNLKAEETEFGARPGMLAGGLLGGNFTPWFGAQIELFYMQKGGADSDQTEQDNYILLDYAEIPLAFKLTLGGAGIQGYFMGGPSAAFKLKCAISLSDTGGVAIEDGCATPQGQTLIESMDFSFNLGAGLNFAAICPVNDPNADCQAINVEYRYGAGFRELSNSEDVLDELRNRSHSVRFTVPVGLRVAPRQP